MKTYPQRKPNWFRKTVRSLLRRCTDTFNKHTEFYVAAKPDFHTGFYRIQEFDALYADWIRQNGRIDRGDLTRFYFLYYPSNGKTKSFLSFYLPIHLAITLTKFSRPARRLPF
jgi:hypothetical protein